MGDKQEISLFHAYIKNVYEKKPWCCLY